MKAWASVKIGGQQSKGNIVRGEEVTEGCDGVVYER